MNTKTGEIISQENVENESENTPLTTKEYNLVKDLEPKERVRTLSEYRHKQKQIAKRRLANKRNKQSHKRKK